MATYREAALAAYAARTQAQADAEAAATQALIAAAQQALVPLFTDSTGKLVADPVKVTAAEHVDEDKRVVVLSITDGSEVSFAVYPDRPEVRIAELKDGRWEGLNSKPVADLDDVGAVLAGEE